MYNFIKALIGIASLCQVNAYSFMNAMADWDKPIYISRSLTDFHRDCVVESVNIINKYNNMYHNIEITDTYIGDSCVRVAYYTPNDPYKRISGSTEFKGTLYDDNLWYVDKMQISINDEIQYFNSCLNVVVHELLHTRGLYHSDVPESIMNMSVIVTTNGILKDMIRPMLSMDDVLGLIEIKHRP